MSQVVQPGATIGVLGSGQLGRMFAIAARRMGYRVHVLSPDNDTPTGQVADVEINAPYDDLEAIASFARAVDVMSFEFENVPCEAVNVVEQMVPVRPAGRVLQITQNRHREKKFLHDAGLPVTPFEAVHSLTELEAAFDRRPEPCVLKTSAWGYDGKGQVMIRDRQQLATGWDALQTDEAILEHFVDFDSELSVVGARGLSGEFACYQPISNSHTNHILDVSVSPADVTVSVAAEAVEIAREVFQQLDVVGVLCVEFFLTRDGRLMINELAPRPHNSGHLTINAHVTCQFEQQVRAVCGLGLGSTEQLRPAAMANLLGDLWQQGAPDWSVVCAYPDVKLHLYGKRSARPGRKMGHLTATADTSATARRRVEAARRALAGNV